MATENTQPEGAFEAETVVIARIIKTRGIKGEVACDVETDFPQRFADLERVTIVTAAGVTRSVVIEDSWFHKGRVILKFEGFDSIDESAQLVGGLVMAPELPSETLVEGEYHEHRLIGAEVVTVDGRRVGTVAGFVHTGGTDILTVRDAQGRELLIPFASEICPDVDPVNRVIRIDPPEGLLDL